MHNSPISVSMIVNAPVEQVWPLLIIEQQQSNNQKMTTQKYLLHESEGPIVSGQVTHAKIRSLHVTVHINQVVQTDPPLTGQTIYARMSFLGKDGDIVASWVHDTDHYHIQTQSELKHPWCEMTEHTSTRCIAIDATSCIIIYAEQSEMTLRLLPRWLTRKLDNDETTRKATARVVEAYLQSIKLKAEQISNQAY